MKTLIRGATILTMDPATGDLPRGDILISGAAIAEVAPEIAVGPDVSVVDAHGMLAVPGFVNAHVHLWQSPLRGMAADWSLTEYLRAMHAGLAGFFTPDDMRLANRAGALDQISAGTTTVADWCHNNPTPDHSDAAIDGLAETGIRAVFLHGSPKPDPGPGQKHFSEVPMPAAEVRRLRNGRLHSDDALVTMGLAILGPQLSVWDVCDHDFRLARDMGLIASMHVSGPLRTPDGFARLAAAGLLGPGINVVHGNILDDPQLDRLIAEGVTFTSTPEVEMQMGFGDPLVARVRARGGQISLGSDIESAMAGDMPTVARFALQAARHADNLSALHAGAVPATVSIPARAALEWATRGGAAMLGLEDRIGSITPGKAADIVLLRPRPGLLQPSDDPAAILLFHGAACRVDTVLIAGQMRKAAGVLTDPAADRVTGDLGQVAARIRGQFADLQAAGGA